MEKAEHGLDRQRPLTVRWAGKDAAEYLKRFGIGAGAAAIAKDLTSTPDQEVSYPRAKGHKSYLAARRYRRPIWTPGNIVGGMDQLDELQLIRHVKQLPGNRSAGMQSFAQALPELVEMVREAESIAGPYELVRPRETIILRDSSKAFLDYGESRETRAMRRNVASINEAVLSTEIGGCEVGAMVRYFNSNLSRGGRFYAQGNSWQNISSELRHQVTISGEGITELDYKCLHPAILYAWKNKPMPSDAYALPGWPRDLVKLALLVVINAQTTKKAVWAIAHSDGRKFERDEAGNPVGFSQGRMLMDTMAEVGSDKAKDLAQKLIDELSILHQPIACYFGKDMGAQLMRVDSKMAEAIMLDMLEQGIVVLPVHDSFLVPASKAGKLEEAMQRAAHQHGLKALQIDAKMQKPPFSPKQLKLF